jgi:hypothetical protein
LNLGIISHKSTLNNKSPNQCKKCMERDTD